MFKGKDFSQISSLEELPVNFNVYVLSSFLGISVSKAYKIAQSENFPRLRFEGHSNKVVIPRKQFIYWYNTHLCSVECNSQE
jgi:hypothetical protein